MKRPTKKNAEKGQWSVQRAGTCLCCCGRFCLCSMQHLFYLLTLISALLAGLLAYIALVGVPDEVTARVENALPAFGVTGEIQKITLAFPNRIRVHDVRLNPVGWKGDSPLFAASALTVHVNLFQWKQGVPEVAQVDVEQGTLVLPVYSGAVQRARSDTLVLDDLQATCLVQTNQFVFPHLSARMNAIRLQGDGAVERTQKTQDESFFTRWSQLFVGPVSGAVPPWLTRLVKRINRSSAQSGTNNIFQTRFHLNADELDENQIVVRGSGQDLRLRRVDFERWQLAAALEEGAVRISDTFFRAATGGVSLALSYCFTNQQIQLMADTSLPADQFLQLLPAHWETAIQQAELSVKGPLYVRVAAGECPVQDLLKQLEIRLQAEQIAWWEFAAERLRLQMEVQDDVLWLEQIFADFGDWPAGGKVYSDGMLYFGNQTFAMNFSTLCNPKLLYPVCAPALIDFIDSFHFSGLPPATQGSLTGRWNDYSTWQYDGGGTVNNFSLNGVQMQSMRAKVHVSNDFVTIENVKVVRDEGELFGRVALPLGEEMASFNMVGQFDPKAAAQLIHPVVVDILEPFEFSGKSHVKASGTVDYANLTQMNFRVDVAATNMGLYTLQFDTCTMSVVGTGDEYRLSHVLGDLYGGVFAGDIVFFPVQKRGPYRYNVTGTVEQIEFSELVQALGCCSNNLPDLARQGVLGGSILLSGLTGSNWVQSLMARGAIRIDQGCLLQIPLFGPLSRFLSRLVPNLGCLTQTEFETDFEVRDGLVFVQDARLHGNVISITISGQYDLEARLLDFDVQVKLLRDNLFSRLINFVTYPITKLFLDFKLSGTLDDPSWRPVNVPKELYFDFD